MGESISPLLFSLYFISSYHFETAPEKRWIGPEGGKILLNAINHYIETDPEGVPPNKVTNVVVEKVDDGIRVSWDDVDAERYEIWRREQGSDIWYIVGIAMDNDSERYEFKEYVYMVRGVDKDFAGEFSEEVAVNQSNRSRSEHLNKPIAFQQLDERIDRRHTQLDRIGSGWGSTQVRVVFRNIVEPTACCVGKKFWEEMMMWHYQ